MQKNSADHSWREGLPMVRAWKEVDKETQGVVACHTFLQPMGPEETLFMDGCPHPPAYCALHAAGILYRLLFLRYGCARFQ